MEFRSCRSTHDGNVKDGGALTYLNGNVYALLPAGAGFSKYNPTTNAWTALTPIGGGVAAGGALTNDGTNIYGFTGGGPHLFQRYNVAANTWTTLTASPVNPQDGAALVTIGNTIYAFPGNSKVLLAYSISAGTWSTATVGQLPVVTGAGRAMVTDGTNLYVMSGGNTSGFYSVNISTATSATAWTTLATTPAAVGTGNNGGGSLALIPGSSVTDSTRSTVRVSPHGYNRRHHDGNHDGQRYSRSDILDSGYPDGHRIRWSNGFLRLAKSGQYCQSRRKRNRHILLGRVPSQAGPMPVAPSSQQLRQQPQAPPIIWRRRIVFW